MKIVLALFSFFVLRVLAANIQCDVGEGEVAGVCKKCTQEGCFQCNEDNNSCRECAPYSRLVAQEGGRIQGCAPCSFGCVTCIKEDECKECGIMFRFSSRNPKECIASVGVLFLVFFGILIILAGCSVICFYITPGVKEEDVKELETQLSRMKSKADELPTSNRLISEANVDESHQQEGS